MLGWRSPAEKVMMSSTHWEVQIIIELMISTCPDNSDGRALDMLSEDRGFKSRSKLHVRFPCNYVPNGLYHGLLEYTDGTLENHVKKCVGHCLSLRLFNNETNFWFTIFGIWKNNYLTYGQKVIISKFQNLGSKWDHAQIDHYNVKMAILKRKV